MARAEGMIRAIAGFVGAAVIGIAVYVPYVTAQNDRFTNEAAQEANATSGVDTSEGSISNVREAVSAIASAVGEVAKSTSSSPLTSSPSIASLPGTTDAR